VTFTIRKRTFLNVYGIHSVMKVFGCTQCTSLIDIAFYSVN